MTTTSATTPENRAYRFEIALKPGVEDARGRRVAAQMQQHLRLAPARVTTRELFTIDAALTPAEADQVRAEFTDPVIQDSAMDRLAPAEPFDWYVLVGFKPGVTDNVGRTARTAIGDILGRRLGEGEAVYTATAYLFHDAARLTRADMQRIGAELLANPLIESVTVVDRDQWAAGQPEIFIPKITADAEPTVARYDLAVGDDELIRISREGTLALSLAEMQAIRGYFSSPEGLARRAELGLDHRPTDVELEMLAQTWSEHCKHKIFAARIDYTDTVTGERLAIDGLFKTYIRAATEEIRRRVDWLVSVFIDNAGVIRFNDRIDVAFKVETHNSPSALEPYGGAMTGIVGCNRDVIGTGLVADMLANVWGYCFAAPETAPGRIPEGVMPPPRLREGVHHGVIDGGNQSGIPYAWGFEFFDERYLAKPLVYCGTIGTLPRSLPSGRVAGTHKKALPGDLIVMTGGRIGKDGIHGATFSSEELHKDSPVQAVQIGDPITQKKMADFLVEARQLDLFTAITDNGAGGLSSSIGEMASHCGGATVDLEKAPLKYAGLQPWEIWLSEAQERMSLAVPPEKIDALANLAERREVELSVLGAFNDSGYLHLRHNGATIGCIAMDFLHDGCPRMELRAEWTPPVFPAPDLAPVEADLGAAIRAMLARRNIASLEDHARQYDHEVKGRTVVKPWIGIARDVPSDATVLLAELDGTEGVVTSYGLNPHLADLDCHAAAQWAVDLAVRRILAVGGALEPIAALDNFCWPDPVESPATPDGRFKLAQLVRANQGLFEICTALNVPLISGKDSMKNDSTRGGRKISIPPSLLVSAIGKAPAIRRCLTMEAKVAGDVVYVVGTTRAELAGSELAWMLHDAEVGKAASGDAASDNLARYPGDAGNPPAIGGAAPEFRLAEAQPVYTAIEAAIREELLHSAHAPALGGLGVSLALMAMGGGLGLEIYTEQIPVTRDDGHPTIAGESSISAAELLFSESPGRFLITAPPASVDRLEELLHGIPHAHIGYVTETPTLKIVNPELRILAEERLASLRQVWNE